MRFLVALLALTLPAFAQIRYSPTGFTAPFISTVTNQASAQAYLGISGGGGGSVTNFGGSATNLQVYSSGTTNGPLQIIGTNGYRRVWLNDDAALYIQNNTTNSYTAGVRLILGEDSFSNPILQVSKVQGGGANSGFFAGQYFSAGGSDSVSNGLTFFYNGNGPYLTVGNGVRIGWNSAGSGSASAMNSADVSIARISSATLGIYTSQTSANLADMALRSVYATNASITNITADSYVTTQQTLSYASATNLTVDANKSLHFVSLTNTAYFAQPSNLGVGRTFTVILQQDGTGTRAVTFNTNYWKFPGGVVPTITTNANAYDVLSCISCPYGTNVFAIHNAKFQ